MGKFKEKLTKFFYGRNGVDALYHFMMFITLVLLIVNFFIPSPYNLILLLIICVNIFFTYFRFFSRNIYKRQKENEMFKNFFLRIGKFFKIRYNMIKYRKVFIYKKCKSCKKMLRFKRIVGNHKAVCPICRYKFEVKIKK